MQQAQRIIVIHPGSAYLRIGRASDLNPHTLLHAIGRGRTPKHNFGVDKNGKPHHDTLLPALEPAALPEFEEQRLQVSKAMQSAGYLPKQGGSKRLRVATPPQQIATFNRRSLPEEVTPQTELKTECYEEQQALFDEELLQLSDDAATAFNIHFPWRRGELHLHSGIGGSMTAVLADLEAIWRYALHHLLGISRSALSHYSAVLVIPDIYHRSHLRELVTLLLQDIGFRSCFLLQDHVAATFGAGLGYACVVDVGDQKCSVSCVEDGISQPSTRVRLGYGGGDVTQVFQQLLRKSCFPYRECNAERDLSDAALLMELKERFCHVNLEVCGAQERTFLVKKPLGQCLRYTLQLGDECIVAPLALFHTELLNITGHPKLARTQARASQQPDSEDCFDAEYIRETGRRNGGRDQFDGSALFLPVTGEPADEELVVDAYDVTERDATSIRNGNEREEQQTQQLYTSAGGQIVPLDQAIVRSIERCSSEELKRKMYGCILLVGGSSKFPGFAKWLEQRLSLHLAAQQHRSPDQPPIELNVFTKEMDAAIIAWKGAAIMSCLESAPELWISAAEWEKGGLRILREKAPFIW